MPGLPAKPVIDLDAVVRPADVPEAISRLAAVGYIHLGERCARAGGVRLACRCVAAPPVRLPVHSPALAEHLRFRDTLRADRQLADEYGRLERAGARYGCDRDGYCEAKTGFIRAALARRTVGT